MPLRGSAELPGCGGGPSGLVHCLLAGESWATARVQPRGPGCHTHWCFPGLELELKHPLLGFGLESTPSPRGLPAPTKVSAPVSLRTARAGSSTPPPAGPAFLEHPDCTRTRQKCPQQRARSVSSQTRCSWGRPFCHAAQLSPGWPWSLLPAPAQAGLRHRGPSTCLRAQSSTGSGWSGVSTTVGEAG